MSLFNRRQTMNTRAPQARSRRPTGISRRRKKQLQFEPLEDRRMMSANTAYYGALGDVQIDSYSSSTADGLAQILANELYWQSLLSNASRSEATTKSIPTDPLLTNQWHLINSGQLVGNPDYQPIYAVPGEDINVAPVWNDGIFGNGVKVAVIDSGVQINHPDLQANIDPGLQFDALTGDLDANPVIGNPVNAHGTSVAGLIGAVANNGEGGTGVAPGVQLVPIRLIDSGQTEQAFIDAFRFATDNGIDITNNSWGPALAERGITGPSFLELLALRDSIYFGRDGKGIIHVFASGNDAGTPLDLGFQSLGSLNSATYNGWVASRYTIGVTGVDHDGFYNNVDGTIFDYAEAGPNIFVAAPTGSNGPGVAVVNEFGLGSGIWTTDTMGDTGFNEAGFIDDRDFLEDTNYTSRFNGTSAAAPLVSGVIALMLEVNPELTWRDVQEILVRSARQNAEFDVPLVNARGSTQNTWITNQIDLFPDPDVWDPAIDPFLQTLNPTLDPLLGTSGTGPTGIVFGSNANHYAASPWVMTNGAGYTVSQGRGAYGEEIGYGHGVIDAELAVQLAQQWHTKNQNLANELTYTSFVRPQEGFFLNLPGREQGNQASGFQYVPGGLGGLPGFIDYWNEYFADEPDFTQGFFARGGYVSLSVPANNAMNVETVEVKLNVEGDEQQFLENVRLVLVSPDGTHHELNDFFYEDAPTPVAPNNIPIDLIGPIDESGVLGTYTVDTTPDGPMVATFSTNRSWGERSDDKFIFDPTTGEPAGGNLNSQGWQLHFENYSPTDFVVDAIEVAWHGSPISANTYRVQGLVGVDDNQDNQFNYSRVTQSIGNVDNDPTTLRYGEVVNAIDPSHESMASNVTVVARRASDGVVVDRFVTGADGNYYFDLVPDDYIISVEDPQGRDAIEDTLSPSNVLPNYETEWHVTSDFFKIWDYDSNLRVPVDSSGVPLSFNGTVTPYHVKDINFLLDPGPPAAPQFEYTGTVIADLNGDGMFNSTDVSVPQMTVYADVNRNGLFDSGEIFVKTDATGQYDLIVPSGITNVVNIGVVAAAGWTFTNPSTGVQAMFSEPGDVFSDIDFYLTPPAGSGAGDGSNEPGYLIGLVYEDVNNNGSRQTNELGVQGVQVFVDSNNNAVHDVSEQTTTTTSNGAFVFADVPAGMQRVRIVPTSPFTAVNPAPGAPRVVSLSGGGTVTQIEFGISQGSGGGTTTSIFDFGDLPADFGITLLSENGARHPRSAYYLGTRVITEEDGKPSPDATGDDAQNDEDGIVIDPISAGTTGHLVATASRHGGVLQGWFDFNGDHVFQDSEKVISNVNLGAGANDVSFTVPDTITSGQIFARFRYGEYGINSVTGPALIGEVEDYLVPVLGPAVQLIHGPDFDDDGDVDGFDFLAWQRGFGKTNATAAQGDADSDKQVTQYDLASWQTGVRSQTAATAAALTVDDSYASELDGPLGDSSLASTFAAANVTSLDSPSGSSAIEVSARQSTNTDEEVGWVATTVRQRQQAQVQRRSQFRVDQVDAALEESHGREAFRPVGQRLGDQQQAPRWREPMEQSLFDDDADQSEDALDAAFAEEAMALES